MLVPNLVIYRDATELLNNVQFARTFLTRLRGLMFYKTMPGINGLLIYPCNSIHTFWMRFPIDVIFMDRTGKVIAVYEALQSNKIINPIKDSFYVLETESGFIKQKELRLGDRLIWE